MIYHSKPILTEEKEKQKRNVHALLFADFGIAPEKALRFLEDLERHPEKAADYNRLLKEHLARQYETIKEKPSDELIAMAKERASDWGAKIGPVSLREYVSLCKQWDVPIGGVIDRKITPELIKEMLDCFVVSQDKYKIKLSVAFYTYLMHRRQARLFLPKSNLLVCGPSGSGKTYGVQLLGKLFHVPFVTVHCNSLVQEGIVGPGLTDGFTSLLADGWLKEEVEQAVVCFDEFDKLFEKSGEGAQSGTYNARIVNELLNIIDDKGEVEFATSFGRDAERIKLPTKRMMFVFTGVFEGLRQAHSKSNLPKANKPIGFLSRLQKEEETATVLDDEPTAEDFIRYGMKPEIMGRIQNCVFLDALTEAEMVGLFDLGQNSPFDEFEQYFAINDINTILTEEGKHTLAEIAARRKLGVRGLKSLIQQVLMEDMYDLEVGEDRVLVVTKQYIMDNLSK